MNFLEHIFSIKYKHLHKVITILGIKLKFKTSVYPTKVFIQKQYSNANNFDAFDVCVRYGFIKEYMQGGLNPDNFWYRLYVKMQTKRGTVNTHNINRFVELIESYKNNNGYISSNPILVSEDDLIDDGSHRTACNLYFNQPYIALKLSNRQFNKRNYGLTWFQNNDFTEEEIKKIIEIKEKIFERSSC